MYMINASKNRTSQEGESYGLSHEEFDEEPTPYTYNGGHVERKTSFDFPQAGGSYGSFKAPSPQIFCDLQEEPGLGETTIYEKMRSSFIDTDEEYINKIKRPLLPKCDAQQETHDDCCHWFWRRQ
jgi:hypothetical protein